MVAEEEERTKLNDSKEGISINDTPLFDIDFSGRKIGDQIQPRGRKRHETRKLSLSSSASNSVEATNFFRNQHDDSKSFDEGDESSSGDDKATELEKALVGEWNQLQLQRGIYSVDDNFFHFGEALTRNQSTKSKQNKAVIGDSNLLTRLWETSFYLLTLQNIENKPQYFFYVITFGHINKNRNVSGALRRRVLYTSGFYLQAGEYRAFNVPLTIYPRKILPVSYKNLANYQLTVNLWKINLYTFNTLYASTSLTLEDILKAEPYNQLILQHQLPDNKRSYEVQRIKVFSLMLEIFEFDLFFDSWSFNPASSLAHLTKNHLKLIKFILPKGPGLPWKVVWTEPSLSGLWKSPLAFVYKGTQQDLQKAYFITKVYIKKDKRSLFFNKYQYIGTSIMSLHSVTSYSVFRSMVKRLTLNEEEFNQGDLFGNVRCFIRSVGVPYYEDSAFLKRPMQPLAGAALVTQLDFREQYLVVRLFRCENLPAANFDTGTSDPIVKIKWDGMTETSSTQTATVRPVWNENYFFPIRLLDQVERVSEPYIKHCLPADLLSKGCIVFECWNQEETSSDFLGGCEVHLSALAKQTTQEYRCLAEGFKEKTLEGSRMADGKPIVFQYKGDDPEQADAAAANIIKEAPQIYETPYLTHVYHGDGIELTGSTIPTSVTLKPLIFFELFCIPPLPKGLVLPAPVPVKEEQDLWKQWSKQWDRDFTRWQHIYRQWFSLAPANRRFLCVAEHPQTRHLHPLPSFVTPIAVPEQLANEGELLHWISNMTFVLSTSQYHSGRFIRWLSANYFLITRRGGINDHAILLCSCLLGLNYDAYVCKGTINNGKDEHCWVMTRHDDGFVVFWETSNKKKYHLPQRWIIDSNTVNEWFQDFNAPEETDMTESKRMEFHYGGNMLRSAYVRAANECGVDISEESVIENVDVYEDDVVPDIRLETLKIDNTRLTIGKEKPKPKQKEKKINRNDLRQWISNQLHSIPIAPQKNLFDPSSTLVYVPYSSIEVVFNNKQLWGNLQNHHPAVIYYDLENPYLWRPFLTQDPNPIDNLVFISPSTNDKACDLLSSEIQADVAESIRVIRSRKGFETQIDLSEEKTERIDKYIDLLEFRMHLDAECDPGPPPNHTAWSSWGIYESVENLQDLNTSWYDHLQRDPAEVTLYSWDATNPVGEPQEEEEGGETTKQEQHIKNEFKSLKKIVQENESQYINMAPQKLNKFRNSSTYTEKLETPGNPNKFQMSPLHAECMTHKDSSFDMENVTKRHSETLLPTTDSKTEMRGSNSCETFFKNQNNKDSVVATSQIDVFPYRKENAVLNNLNTYIETPILNSEPATTVELNILAPEESGNESITNQIKVHNEKTLKPNEVTIRLIDFLDNGNQINEKPQLNDYINTCWNIANMESCSFVQELSSNASETTSHDSGSDTMSVVSYCLHENIKLSENMNDKVFGKDLDTLVTNCIFTKKQCENVLTHSISPKSRNTGTMLSIASIDSNEFFDCELISEKSGGSSELISNRTIDDSEFHDIILNPEHYSFTCCAQHEMIIDDYENLYASKKDQNPLSGSEVYPIEQRNATISGTDETLLYYPGDEQHGRPKEFNNTVTNQLETYPAIKTDYSHPHYQNEICGEQVANHDVKGHQQSLTAPMSSGIHKKSKKNKKTVIDTPATPYGAIAPYGATIPYDAKTLRTTTAPYDATIAHTTTIPYGATTPQTTTAPYGATTPYDATTAHTTTTPYTATTPDITTAPYGTTTPAVLSDIPPPLIFRRSVPNSQYQIDQHAKWNYYYRMESLYYDWQKIRFPVRASHTFCGFPLHFSTSDFSEIRTFLFGSKRFRQTIDVPIDGVIYFIRCKIFPLMGGVVSCWLFLGYEISWAGKHERQSRMKVLRKTHGRKLRQ